MRALSAALDGRRASLYSVAMAKREAHRLPPLPVLWVGAALLGGCSEGATSTSASHSTEVAIEAQAPKQAQLESEKPAKPRPATDDPCPTICSRTTTLECGPLANCLRGCAEMRSADKCGDELKGFLRCSAAHPVEHWECDPETGSAAVRDGYCNSEQGAVVACLQRAR